MKPHFPYKHVVAGFCVVGCFHLLLRFLPEQAGNFIAVAVAIAVPVLWFANLLMRNGTLCVLEDGLYSVLDWVDEMKVSRLRRQEAVDARRRALAGGSVHA